METLREERVTASCEGTSWVVGREEMEVSMAVEVTRSRLVSGWMSSGPGLESPGQKRSRKRDKRKGCQGL